MQHVRSMDQCTDSIKIKFVIFYVYYILNNEFHVHVPPFSNRSGLVYNILLLADCSNSMLLA